jgi:hypothetical protein
MLTGRKLPLTLAFAVLVVLAFGASCKGFFVDPKLTTITVTPATPQIVTGDTPRKMTATGTYDDNSTSDLSGSVTWTMSPEGFATIDKVGKLTGTGPTTSPVTLTATLGIISGQTTFTVALGNVSQITVTPSNTSIQTSGTFELQAMATIGSAQQDISGSATWIFKVHGTGTVETGMTKGNTDSSGQWFTVGTLTPTAAPVSLDVVATYPKTGGGTVTSNTVTVDVTQ